MIDLLENDAERHAMRKRAYLHSRQTTWPQTARAYMGTFQRARFERSLQPRPTQLDELGATDPNDQLPVQNLIAPPDLSPKDIAMEPGKSARLTDVPLFVRNPGNPILSRENWPYPINSVFNAGAVRLTDGDTLLLCRVEDRTGLSHLCAARSTNGIDGWRIDPQPTLMASPREHPEEIWGIEAPRITYVPELEQYAIAHTSFARGGPAVSLALTRDFRSFERCGVIMPPEDKDAALLPRPQLRIFICTTLHPAFHALAVNPRMAGESEELSRPCTRRIVSLVERTASGCQCP